MSGEARKHRMCTSKVAYENHRHARTDLKRLLKRGFVTNAHHAYRCPHCQKWHIGGRLPKEKLRESRRQFKRDQEES